MCGVRLEASVRYYYGNLDRTLALGLCDRVRVFPFTTGETNMLMYFIYGTAIFIFLLGWTLYHIDESKDHE